MSKVSISIIGGLGNNLFQIACAYAYSLKHNKELILVNEKFGIPHNPLDTYKTNILRNVKFVDKYDFSKFTIYNEPFFHYQEIPFIEGDVCLSGYFQSEKYFQDYYKEIKELFSVTEEYKNLIIEKHKHLLTDNTCSIHVRRGDYLQFPDRHPVQNLNYFMKGVKNMSEDTKFLIFSDDISWCKQNFPNVPEKFIFMEGATDYEDLLLMSLCQNNIIANSSFSWWGAWLNENIDKIVISPSKWFGNANSAHNIQDLIPENWIKI